VQTYEPFAIASICLWFCICGSYVQTYEPFAIASICFRSENVHERTPALVEEAL
ncbi:hypothetical protein STEG23_024181, partial [Scotinomys teguina]